MAKQPSVLSSEVLSRIAQTIQGIRFGSVQITIQDSRVVQIEKAEKIRLGKDADLPAPCHAQEASRSALPVQAARQAGLTTGGACEEPSLADRTTGGFQPSPGR